MRIDPAAVQELVVPLSVADCWSVPSSANRGYLLTDPLSGERIDTQRPPTWVEDDEVLRGGLDYLRRNAQKLDLTVLLSRHRTAEDLGDIHEADYEHSVAQADFYGYEGMDTREAIQRQFLRGTAIVGLAFLQGERPELAHFLAAARGTERALRMPSFDARQLAACTLLGTPSFPADIISDDSVVEQAVTKALPTLFSHPDPGVVGSAFIGFDNAREWIAAAHLGVEVSRHFGELTSPLRGLVTFGAEHKDLERKFGLLGVPARSEAPKNSSNDPRLSLDTQAIFVSGVVPAGITPLAASAAWAARGIFAKKPQNS